MNACEVCKKLGRTCFVCSTERTRQMKLPSGYTPYKKGDEITSLKYDPTRKQWLKKVEDESNIL